MTVRGEGPNIEINNWMGAEFVRTKKWDSVEVWKLKGCEKNLGTEGTVVEISCGWLNDLLRWIVC